MTQTQYTASRKLRNGNTLTVTYVGSNRADRKAEKGNVSAANRLREKSAKLAEKAAQTTVRASQMEDEDSILKRFFSPERARQLAVSSNQFY